MVKKKKKKKPLKFPLVSFPFIPVQLNQPVFKYDTPSLYYLKHFFWAQKVLLDQVKDREILDKIV